MLMHIRSFRLFGNWLKLNSDLRGRKFLVAARGFGEGLIFRAGSSQGEVSANYSLIHAYKVEDTRVFIKIKGPSK